MSIEETYNIHKIISCIVPHFKSKILCKHNLHNYQICGDKKGNIYWKCYCCKKVVKGDNK